MREAISLSKPGYPAITAYGVLDTKYEVLRSMLYVTVGYPYFTANSYFEVYSISARNGYGKSSC